MKVKGITATSLCECIHAVNRKHLTKIEPHFKKATGRFEVFTLRLGYGISARPSQNPFHKVSHSGRKLNAVCWHGHREVMREIFKIAPDAILVSTFARYEGREHFERTHGETGLRNIGSQVQPLMMQDACDCCHS